MYCAVFGIVVSLKYQYCKILGRVPNNTACYVQVTVTVVM